MTTTLKDANSSGLYPIKYREPVDDKVTNEASSALNLSARGVDASSIEDQLLPPDAALRTRAIRLRFYDQDSARFQSG
jgi:hypothetical protein